MEQIINVCSFDEDQLKVRVAEHIKGGWEIVTPITPITEVKTNKFNRGSYTIQKYKCVMRRMSVDIVKEVSTVVKENERLNKKLSKALEDLSKLKVHHEKTKEKLSLTRNSKKRMEIENKALIDQLSSAKKQIQLMTENLTPKKAEYEVKRKGKTSVKKGYKASVTYKGREMVIDYFKTPEEAREAEKRALENLA